MTRSLSVVPRLEAAAGTSGSVTFLGSAAGAAGPEQRVTWAELHDDARRMAAALQARGVAPGTHVAILGPTTRPLVTAIQATWLCGAATVMLPLPMRLASIEEFVAQTRARILASDNALVVVDAQLAEFLDPAPGDPPSRDARRADVGAALDRRVRTARRRSGSLAILQYTSGSTADPRGVMLPHRCVTANRRRDRQRRATRSRRRPSGCRGCRCTTTWA